jgi:hypothetical protein
MPDLSLYINPSHFYTHANTVKAIIIIIKLSFWIHKPFLQSLVEAYDQFKNKEYLKYIKTGITPASMPSGHENLVAFLYKHINDINGMYFI